MLFETITLNKKNITDFAKERNILLKNSKAEWVFFLDMDETVSKNLKEEMVTWLNGQMVDKYNGAYIYRKNYFLGKYIGTDKILRLGKKDSGKWERGVHEEWIVKGKMGTLKNPIIHETAKSLQEYIGKINFYSTLHAKENIKEGKKSNIVKIVFYPPLKFIQSLFLGRNFVFSMLQSFHSFLAWSNQWLLTRNTIGQKHE